MSIAVVGSIALDTIKTPWGQNEDGLGGAATYFSIAAANFARVNLVGVVGDDFPPRHVDLLGARDIDLAGLERAPGKTFRWTARYAEDVNDRETLATALNVFESFHPKLPEGAQDAPYLFLGNIHPSLQFEVLRQSRRHFAAMDTMNLWIDITQEELKTVLREVDALFINDAEARQLTGCANVIEAAHRLRALGPHIIVVKKGEHGSLLFGEQDQIFAAPAMPLREVVDPTGAGDSFAGGFMGHVARKDATDFQTLKEAVVYGTVAASFACESFGPDALARATLNDIQHRYERFHELTAF